MYIFCSGVEMFMYNNQIADKKIRTQVIFHNSLVLSLFNIYLFFLDFDEF